MRCVGERMPVTWRREFYLECDGKDCNATLMLDDMDTPFKNPTVKTFRRVAEKSGWRIDRNNCWCPDCSTK